MIFVKILFIHHAIIVFIIMFFIEFFGYLFCRKIAEVMNITEYVTDLKAATVLDYYVAAFWWAKEQNFNVEQLSAFFTVVHTLLENIKGGSMQF